MAEHRKTNIFCRFINFLYYVVCNKKANQNMVSFFIAFSFVLLTHLIWTKNTKQREILMVGSHHICCSLELFAFDLVFPYNLGKSISVSNEKDDFAQTIYTQHNIMIRIMNWMNKQKKNIMKMETTYAFFFSL